jgi:peptidoglycan/LPS O-acetylase OafA/YrhL
MNHSAKIYSLQVYRAIAAIMVVLYHITDLSQKRFDYTFLGSIFSFGYVGADFFFVLSGFIILYVHRQDIGCPQQLRGYLVKRFIRLYPIYWLIASAKILMIFLLPSLAKSYETDPWYLIRSLLLIPQQKLPIIGAAWTLSYEILFYLLFGLMIFLGGRWAFGVMTAWTGIILSSFILTLTGLVEFSHLPFMRFFLNERNLEFILGCLAAYLVVHGRIKFGGGIAFAGAILFALFAGYLNKNGEPFSFTLTFGLASFLLVVGSASVEMQREIKWPKLLTFLGDASYSIYLTHVMFINIFTVIFTRLQFVTLIGPLLATLLMVVLAITGGSFVYLFLEKWLISTLRRKLLSPKKSYGLVPEHSKGF